MADHPCRLARDEIWDLILQNGANSFFPLDSLRVYFSLEKTKEILLCRCARCHSDFKLFGNQSDPDSYAKEIIGVGHDQGDLTKTYFSVFGLLIYVEHPIFIIGFLKKNSNDYILEAWVTDQQLFDHERIRSYTGELWKNATALKRFVEQFNAEIPKFAIPHLDSERFCQFGSKAILPFVNEHEIGTRIDEQGHLVTEGANGRVFAFRIPREYCKFKDLDPRSELVRKQIETPKPEAYLEHSSIQFVQKFNHKHIVRLIKGYGYGNAINLVFPRAWTNLYGLLRNEELQYSERRGARLETADAWHQFLGIAKALKTIQGFSEGPDSRANESDPDKLCIHFDLKPENILIDKRTKTWMITDFGSSAVINRRAGLTPRVGGHFGTDDYAPPEIEYIPIESGRRYDIWSLGCILLELAAFQVRGYCGLKGSGSFVGLDQARATTTNPRFSDTRFFCQDRRTGEYIVKKEIRDFMANLTNSYAREHNVSNESKEFLVTVLDLVQRMLSPSVKERIDISRVIDTLSSALLQATAENAEFHLHQITKAPDEVVIGGKELNEVKLHHYANTKRRWETASLELFENETGHMRVCWHPGSSSLCSSFPRGNAKILAHYAFRDPKNSYDTNTWLELVYLSKSKVSKVPDTMFSFDGDAGLKGARLVLSKFISQNIEGSFALSTVRIQKSESLSFRKLFRKARNHVRDKSYDSNPRFLNFDSATVQVWVETENGVAANTMQREAESIAASSVTQRAVRIFEEELAQVTPCRIAIFLRQQRFICTVRIDTNWQLELDAANEKVLYFKPDPRGPTKSFYASWIRPTPEEFRDGYPAGIPLKPKVLHYYEDLDLFEVDQFELTFLNSYDREDFELTFLEAKSKWEREWKAAHPNILVNRLPEDKPQPPDDVGVLPVPQKWADFLPNTSYPRTVASASTGTATRSSYESSN